MVVCPITYPPFIYVYIHALHDLIIIHLIYRPIIL